MSNRYEQSLKEQAARIRRELAGEKETKPVERPKKEEREDRFVLTDVPSPIYGFQRPKKQRSIQEEENSNESEVDVSSELEEEKMKESLVQAADDTNETSVIETMEQTDLTEAEAGLVPTTDSDLLVPEPTIERAPEERFEETIPDTQEDVLEETADVTTNSVDEDVQMTVSPEPDMPELVERTATDAETKPVETNHETDASMSATEEQAESLIVPETSIDSPEEISMPQAKPVSIKKPVGPPVNVVMTTKDLMAMYRARREENNLHGKK
ncbi:hypothetical protein ACWS7L_00135 [Exiguobacterium artemiae]